MRWKQRWTRKAGRLLFSHSYSQVPLITRFLENKFMATKVSDLPLEPTPMTHAMHELPKISDSPKTRDMDYVPRFFSHSHHHTHIAIPIST